MIPTRGRIRHRDAVLAGILICVTYKGNSLVLRRSQVKIMGVGIPAVAAICLASACASPSESSCLQRSSEAKILKMVVATAPPLAAQNGIGGDVVLSVMLTPSGEVAGVSVVQSTSPLLNGPAIAAARASTYTPRVKNCKRVGSVLRYTAHFPE